MSDALNDDKDPKILTDVSFADEPIVGFSPKDINRPFEFTFLDGSKITATLTGANVHCAYDEDGKPRNLMINLDFK